MNQLLEYFDNIVTELAGESSQLMSDCGLKMGTAFVAAIADVEAAYMSGNFDSIRPSGGAGAADQLSDAIYYCFPNLLLKFRLRQAPLSSLEELLRIFRETYTLGRLPGRLSELSFSAFIITRDYALQLGLGVLAVLDLVEICGMLCDDLIMQFKRHSLKYWERHPELLSSGYIFFTKLYPGSYEYGQLSQRIYEVAVKMDDILEASMNSSADVQTQDVNEGDCEISSCANVMRNMYKERLDLGPKELQRIETTLHEVLSQAELEKNMRCILVGVVLRRYADCVRLQLGEF